ncbi:hypothetical protein [Actinoplanes palleronii]|uniref:DUF1963 domain-containing protein n=1 Tax=Actinoplanes palleronii TaxID=113570 RepID=A0ABQ4BQ50_9ACTN|nr:hypothetical protein [Actinoplanes palleronii]GIE72803.1 hypothetical protein Apa02nite_089110 [Actinoplanes palleronii]
MTNRESQIIDQFRAEALRRDIPAADVERWLGLARPCAVLTRDGDGPVAGAIRGPVLLPAGAEDPMFPLIAGIDLAALPAGATDLPLPADGSLLLFGWPEEDGWGRMVYVPAGADVRERPEFPEGLTPEDPEYAEVYALLAPGDLHLSVDVSLPYVGTVPGHDRSEELTAVWREVFADRGLWQPLLLGGYGTDDNGVDPVRAAGRPEDGDWDFDETEANVEDWVLVAEFHGARPGGATIFWLIRRKDLAARHFDQARILVDWNP